jgi:hypothetical protein
MVREVDWEALDQLQFLLMRRMTEPLNAGLAAISLIHMDTAADKPREYWQERATGEVLGVLNLVNAWHALIRYKLGELLPHQHIRPFNVQDLLDWLSYHLELVSPLQVEENLIIESSRECLQEALLMLYSAAYTLGPNVHLVVQSTAVGVWFRVRYARSSGEKPCPGNLDVLLERLNGNWRLEDTAFELKTAADFILLSGSQLHLQGTDNFCEMAFFVYAVGHRPPDPLKMPEVTQPPPIATDEAEELLIAYANSAKDADATQVLHDDALEADLEDLIDATLDDIFADDATPHVAQRPLGTKPLKDITETKPSESTAVIDSPPQQETSTVSDDTPLVDPGFVLPIAPRTAKPAAEPEERPRVVWAKSHQANGSQPTPDSGERKADPATQDDTDSADS